MIPHADPLPATAPGWLFWTLLMVTFAIHIVAMNFVLGGSIIAAFARFRKTPESARLAQWIGRAMPTLVATAVTFGVAPLLFLQVLYGRLFFTSSVLMGWWWLAVVPIVIFAYYGTYAISFGDEKLGRYGAPLAAAVALLFTSVAFIYVNNMSLMTSPERFFSMFIANARGTQLNIADATLVPRFLHMLLGAVAVAGLIVAIYGVVAAHSDREQGLWQARHGSTWFVGATAFNLVAGFWWLSVLPREAMLRFMGRDALATAFFAIGMLAGFAALVVIARAIKSDEPQRYVVPGAWILGLSLVTMLVSRDQLRRGLLQAAGFEVSTWVEPQWGVIAIFVVLFVAAVAATAWMMSLLFRPRTVARPSVLTAEPSGRAS